MAANNASMADLNAIGGSPPTLAANMSLQPAVPAELGAREAAHRVEAGFLTSWAELNLTLLIFAFGLIALLMFYWIVRTEKGTPFLFRIYVVIILVFGTLLIVSSAYTTEQIAPVVGFFGTIAGYLLGRGDRADAADK